MKRKLVSLTSLLTFVVLLSGCGKITVLDPQGPVARQQSHLILWSVFLMLIIVLGVFIAFTLIVVRYRDRPDHQGHDPEQEGNKKLEVLWTVIPIIIVIALAIPTIKTIFNVEHPAAASQHKKPLTIRVVSADWKWIFVYPEQGIETVNYVNIPADRPVKFKLTSTGAMTSFWVPSLGGQKYAMSGMQTQLILEADHPGTYKGRNANFSGKEYAKMTFPVHSQSKQDFQAWVKNIQNRAPKLTKKKYVDMIQPGTTGKMSFSSTHLQWVNHAKDPEFQIKHSTTKPPH
jgi:cytochrome aa3-600 menaquinol oxidase subunit 2